MAGPIRIAILANGRQARAEANLTAKTYSQMGKQIRRLAGFAAGAFAVREIFRAGQAITATGGQYVSSLNKIQALTGATRAELTRAAQQIEAGAGAYAKMGQTSSDAAAGVVELTKAGLSLGSSLSAVRATMTLAKAGELEVADASTLVANTLNTFHLKARQAADIANGLANAANISSADVRDLAESFKYVAPIAAKSGVTLDQTNAILAELANSGIKASQAGTSLRKFLLSLQAPSGAAANVIDDLGIQIYNARGKMLPLPRVIDNINGSLKGLTDQRRNEALKSVFGLTGITGAQVILENGAKGLATYTKGVQRAGAAQKLANAQSRGLLGTLSQLKARATSSVQALYRLYSPKINAAIKTAIKWVTDHKDQLLQAGHDFVAKVRPAVEQVTKALGNLAAATKDAAGPVGKVLVPAFGAALKLAETGARLFNALPGPLRTIGIEAGIAALVLPKLSAAVTSVTTTVGTNIARLQQFRAELTYTETRTQALTTVTSKLGAAAKTAAGVGGLVLLAQGAQNASKPLGKLETVAGSVLTGFAVGGPWGAAIGGAAGALGVLATASHKSAVQMVDGHAAAKKLAASLDQVTGAATRATRAQVLDTITKRMGADGMAVVNRALKDLGLTQRDLVGYVLGETAATRRLNGAIRDNKHARDDQKQAAARQLDLQRQFLRGDRQDAQEAHRLNRQRTLDLSSWKEALQGFPKAVKVRLEQLGYRPSIEQIRALGKRYDLTPRQVSTLIRLTGVDEAQRGAKRTQDALRDAGRTKIDTQPWQSSLKQALTSGTATATIGGKRVGNALADGVKIGIGARVQGMINAAQSAVAQALAAAHREADAHSPSRKMQKLGEYLGDGLILGMRSREVAVAAAGRRMTSGAIAPAGGYHSRSGGAGGRPATRLEISGKLDTPWGPAQIEGIARGAARQEIENQQAWADGLSGLG